jgi:hypothetical protein
MTISRDELDAITPGPMQWLIFAIVGVIAGADVAGWVYRHYAQPRAMSIMATFTIFATGLMFGMLAKQGVKLRRFKRRLDEEREALLERMRVEVEAHFPGNPRQVERVMNQIREGVFKQ